MERFFRVVTPKLMTLSWFAKFVDAAMRDRLAWLPALADPRDHTLKAVLNDDVRHALQGGSTTARTSACQTSCTETIRKMQRSFQDDDRDLDPNLDPMGRWITTDALAE